MHPLLKFHSSQRQNSRRFLGQPRQASLAEFPSRQSVPKAVGDYTKKLAWIDKKSFLPLKEEYYDAQNELARLFTAEKVENVSAESSRKVYPTITRRAMKNVKSGHRTDVTFTNIAYDAGLDDGVFSEGSLQSPPQKWIK